MTGPLPLIVNQEIWANSFFALEKQIYHYSAILPSLQTSLTIRHIGRYPKNAFKSLMLWYRWNSWHHLHMHGFNMRWLLRTCCAWYDVKKVFSENRNRIWRFFRCKQMPSAIRNYSIYAHSEVSNHLI